MRTALTVSALGLLGAVAIGPEGALGSGLQGQPRDPAALLGATATSLDQYERAFSAVVAQENYVMTMTSSVGNQPMGDAASMPPSRTIRRGLVSDVMMLSLGPAEWVQFRDVYQADGQPVHDHAGRLEALLAKPPSDVLAQAKQIANESARYNLGVARNFNVPTMALAYLGRRNQARSTFTVKGSESIDGQATTVVEFRETARPSLIRNGPRDVETHGRAWIAPATGAVLQTEIHCQVEEVSAHVDGVVTVTYRRDPTLDVLVPVTMTEEYHRTPNETDAGYATYSNFRRFTVDTAAIRRGGGGR